MMPWSLLIYLLRRRRDGRRWRLCRACGHYRLAHEHYRAGTECATVACGCGMWVR